MSIQFLNPLMLAALALVPAAWWLGFRSGRLGAGRRRWSVVLRAVILTLIILALARPRLVRDVDETSVAFLIDASDSVPRTEADRAVRMVQESIASAGAGDLSAIVVFGQEPVVERAAREGPLDPIRSVAPPGRTDLAAALRLGLALLPSDTGRRIVVLSDGRDNLGGLARQTDQLAAVGVPVDVVPLVASLSADEAVLTSLDAPASTRVGQRFVLDAAVRASAAGRARVTVMEGPAVVFAEDVDLVAGENHFEVPMEATTPGVRKFEASILPERDSRIENNQASAFSIVAGPPKVLVVAEETDQAAPLMGALEGADRIPVLVKPPEVPNNLLGLAEYDAVILVNVPARALPAGAMDVLAAFVRDLGHGLVMIGGDRSYGAGGYRNTPLEKVLPVDMEVRDRESRPDTALAFVVDKSGSMAECTDCGGGPGFGGRAKVDLAKEAVAQAAEVLNPEDRLGLVAFDDRSHVVWPVSPNSDPEGFVDAVGGIRADGGTNIYSGIAAAVDELEQTDVPIRHVLLLTDGWSDSTGYERVLARMDDAGITMSVVAVGPNPAPYLEQLAIDAAGRFYPVTDPADIPQIFVDETITTLGMYLIEERFQPVPGASSPVMAGIDTVAVPPLGGYNGTTAKQSAQVALWSHREDPVLATWQHGLGRSVAWTSDLKRQWAADWVGWTEFGEFALQLVDWTVPAPDNEGFAAQTTVEAGRAAIRLAAADSGGLGLNALDVEAHLAGPDGVSLTVPLGQSGVGAYEGFVDLPAQGAYIVRVVAKSGGAVVGSQTAGLVVPYSPEYSDPTGEPTDPRLFRLAEITQGRVLTDPSAAFDAVPGARRTDDVWTSLLLAAVLLFPADVGVRRLKIARGDFHAALAWLAARRPTRRPAVAGSPRFGSLASARDRAREQAARRAGAPTAVAARTSTLPDAVSKRTTGLPPRGTGGVNPAAAPAEAGTATASGPTTEVPPDPVEDTVSRLRAAKRRAKAGGK